MPKQEFRQVAKLGYGEVGGEGSLFSFFADDSDT